MGNINTKLRVVIKKFVNTFLFKMSIILFKTIADRFMKHRVCLTSCKMWIIQSISCYLYIYFLLPFITVLIYTSIKVYFL